MEKKYTVSDIKKAVFMCFDRGLYSAPVGYMLGMPTNNIDDFYDAVGNNSLNKENITHNARLFVSDYHNFRGYNSREQAMSNQTSWRTTTV